MTASSSEGYILTASRIVKTFKVRKGSRRTTLHVLNDVDVALLTGKTLGLAGESGCGKTTLGRLLVGLDKPDSGTIILDGMDVTKSSRRQLRNSWWKIQMIFQDPFSSLNPRWSVRRTVREPILNFRVGTASEQRDRVGYLLETVGLPGAYGDLYPHQMSGGERQRVAIARALSIEPKVVICDEVVSALDVSVQAQILNLLRDLQERFRLSMLFISHALPVLKYISDEIAVMYLGTIVEQCSSGELFREPLHPYTKGLLDSVLVPDPRFSGSTRTPSLNGEVPTAARLPRGCVFSERCPRAFAVCREEGPVLKEPRSGHLVACHLY
jgi:oligopeptide/dipeptide ABC transporter ATP-binding protein